MKLILAATITSTHGIRGQFKVKVLLSEPSNIFEHKLYDQKGDSLAVKKVGGSYQSPICIMEQVSSVETARRYVGLCLHLNRLELPDLPEGRFYKSDLIGLQVINRRREEVGVIETIENFGAGEIVILKASNGVRSSYPLTKQFFAHIGEHAVIEDIINI